MFISNNRRSDSLIDFTRWLRLLVYFQNRWNNYLISVAARLCLAAYCFRLFSVLLF